MRNYIFKRSENWKPKDAGPINEWLEKINVNESETHYIGVVVRGFTWQQNYAYEATGNNELADKLFSEVEKRQEVVSTLPKDNKSFMPYSSRKEDIYKYIEDAFSLHEEHFKRKNIWLDLRFIDEADKTAYMDEFVKTFSKSKYVQCIFVAAD